MTTRQLGAEAVSTLREAQELQAAVDGLILNSRRFSKIG